MYPTWLSEELCGMLGQRVRDLLPLLPEFILHARSALKSWFCDFISSCMHQLKIRKNWRRALVVAIPKPEKPLGDPKSYRSISLLCVPFKILERLIYAHVKIIIDPLLPQEQAGFRHGRSTVDQVTLLTQDIEDSFSAKKKAGAVFVDLTAAYDTAWHRGLTCKLLRLPPDIHMVHMIMEMVSNRSFILTTANGKVAGYDASKTASHRDLSWGPGLEAKAQHHENGVGGLPSQQLGS